MAYAVGNDIGSWFQAGEGMKQRQLAQDEAWYRTNLARQQQENAMRFNANAEANRQANLAQQYQFADEAAQRAERQAAQANALGLADRARAQYEFGTRAKTQNEQFAEELKLRRDLGIENKAVKDAAEARLKAREDQALTERMIGAAGRGEIGDGTTLNALMPPSHPAYEATKGLVAQQQAARMVEYEAADSLANQLGDELQAKVKGNVMYPTWNAEQKLAALAAAIEAKRTAWNRRKGVDFDKAFAVNLATGEVTNNLPQPSRQDLIEKFGNKWQPYPNFMQGPVAPPVALPQTNVAPPVVTPLETPSWWQRTFGSTAPAAGGNDPLREAMGGGIPGAYRSAWGSGEVAEGSIGWTQQQMAKAQLKGATQTAREAEAQRARTNAPAEGAVPPGGWPSQEDRNPEDISATVRRLRAEQMARTNSDMPAYRELMAAQQALAERNAADVEARNRAPGMGVGRYLPDFATASNAGRRSGVGWSGLLGREDANAIPSYAQYAFMAPEMQRGYEANATRNAQMDDAAARRLARIYGLPVETPMPEIMAYIEATRQASR